MYKCLTLRGNRIFSKSSLAHNGRYYTTSRFENHYEKLGVARSSTQKEIRDAYLKKVKQLHPDKSNEDTHKEFIAVQTAYDILGKPDSRLAYDSNFRNTASSHPLNQTKASTARNPYGYPPQPNIKRAYGQWHDESWTPAQARDHYNFHYYKTSDYQEKVEFNLLLQRLGIFALMAFSFGLVFSASNYQRQKEYYEKNYRIYNEIRKEEKEIFRARDYRLALKKVENMQKNDPR